MFAEQPHKLILAQRYPSGAEEWHCPTCERRFVMQWTPEYQRVMLNVGDESVVHNTGQGAMVRCTQAAEDPRLEPWQEWLQNVHFPQAWDD